MATRRPSIRPIALTGLRGFEASARLMSFTLAAAELHLTQSSISRQIKLLESQIGKPLFRRRIRRLELTAAGQRLIQVIQTSLGDIDRVVGEIRNPRRRKQITLTTFASLASLLLVPRLAKFSALQPNVDIRIDAVDEVRDLESEGIDVAIRYCRSDKPPRDAVLLQFEELIPVISPTLLARIGPITKPVDLARATFLVQDVHLPYAQYFGWERWFSILHESMPEDAATISLNFTYQAVEAALRGQGVMLAPLIFVRDHLSRGDLVCPLPIGLASPYGYYLFTNRQTAQVPHIAAFAQWLTGELRHGPEASGKLEAQTPASPRHERESNPSSD